MSLPATCKVKICKLKAISEHSRIIWSKALLLPPGGQGPMVWRQCWGRDHMKRCGGSPRGYSGQHPDSRRSRDVLRITDPHTSSENNHGQASWGSAQAGALWACSGTQQPTSHLQACWCPKFLPLRSHLLAGEADNRHAGLEMSGVNLGHAYILDSQAMLQTCSTTPPRSSESCMLGHICVPTSLLTRSIDIHHPFS